MVFQQNMSQYLIHHDLDYEVNIEYILHKT